MKDKKVDKRKKKWGLPKIRRRKPKTPTPKKPHPQPKTPEPAHKNDPNHRAGRRGSDSVSYFGFRRPTGAEGDSDSSSSSSESEEERVRAVRHAERKKRVEMYEEVTKVYMRKNYHWVEVGPGELDRRGKRPWSLWIQVRSQKESDSCIYASAFSATLRPFQRAFIPLLRWPILLKTDEKEENDFAYKYKRGLGIGGWITSIFALIFFIYTLFSCVMFYIYINKSSTPDYHSLSEDERLRVSQRYLMARHCISIVIILCLWAQALVSIWTISRKGRILAEFYSIWAEAVEEMKVDVGYLVARNMFIYILLLGFYILILILAYLINVCPMARGLPGIFWTLLCREFYLVSAEHIDGKIPWLDPFFPMFQSFCGLWILYLVICQVIIPILFIHVARCLGICFQIWNRRLEVRFNRKEMSKMDAHEVWEDRLAYSQLYSDYVLLLDLLYMADSIFCGPIYTFLAIQMIRFVYEAYYLSFLISSPDIFVKSRRQYDLILLVLMNIKNLWIVCLIMKNAFYVHEQAMRTVKILYSRGVMFMYKKREFHFILTLYSIFYTDWDLCFTSGRVISLTKYFLLEFILIFASYMIVVYQIGPDLSIKDIDFERVIGDSPAMDKQINRHIEGTLIWEGNYTMFQ